MKINIIKNPAGTYSLVGRIPTDVCELVEASAADVMGGRAFKDGEKVVTWKTPVFKTLEAACSYIQSRGHEVA